MPGQDVSVRLPLSIDDGPLAAAEARLASMADHASNIQNSLANAGAGMGGGGGPGPGPGPGPGGGPGGGGGGVGPGSGGRGGQSVGRRVPGRMPQAPMPSMGGVNRLLAAVPFGGAVLAGAFASMSVNYGAWSQFQGAQASVAPFATPFGNIQEPVHGFGAEQALSAQLEMSRAAGTGRDRASVKSALGYMRGRGLSAGDIGSFERPFGPDMGLGGVTQAPGTLLARGLGAGKALGFDTARFPELLQALSGAVTTAGGVGLQTSDTDLFGTAAKLGSIGFKGSRGIAGLQSAQGVRAQMAGQGGDDLVRGILLRSIGGLGEEGVDVWEANKRVDAAGPGAVTSALVKASLGMGDYGRQFLKRATGLSRDEVDRLREGWDGASGDVEEVGTGMESVKGFLSTSDWAAKKRGMRIGIGKDNAETTERIEMMLLAAEKHLVELVAPLFSAGINALEASIDKLQELWSGMFDPPQSKHDDAAAAARWAGQTRESDIVNMVDEMEAAATRRGWTGDARAGFEQYLRQREGFEDRPPEFEIIPGIEVLVRAARKALPGQAAVGADPWVAPDPVGVGQPGSSFHIMDPKVQKKLDELRDGPQTSIDLRIRIIRDVTLPGAHVDADGALVINMIG